MGDRLLVLGWHNVESTSCFPSLRGAGVTGLRRQLTFLGRFATVVPLFEALETLAAGRSLPPARSRSPSTTGTPTTSPSPPRC